MINFVQQIPITMDFTWQLYFFSSCLGWRLPVLLKFAGQSGKVCWQYLSIKTFRNK